jgi:hypothetical protein
LQLMDTTPGAHRGMALLMYARGEDERGGTHWLHFEKAQQGGEARVRELMGEN